jgi:hypothetical protein
MSGGLVRYNPGRGVGLDAFGIRQPYQQDVRESAQVSAGIDRLLAIAVNEQNQTAVADYAEEGAKAALARNPDGTIAAPTLYKNDTAPGRAFNAAAVRALSMAVLGDADQFARETITRIQTENDANGVRKATDMLAAWDAAWEPYANKALANMPDVVRAEVAEKIQSEGLRYRHGLAVKQNEEAVDRDVSTLTIAASRFANDALTLGSMPGKTKEADDAAAQFESSLNAIAVRGAGRVDPAKLEEMRINFRNARTMGTAFQTARGLLETELAKNPDKPYAAVEKVSDFLDTQALTPEHREIIKNRIVARADKLNSERNEGLRLAADAFTVGELPALAAEAARLASTQGAKVAGDFLTSAAKGRNNRLIEARLAEMSVAYLQKGASVMTPEAVRRRTDVLTAYETGYRNPDDHLAADYANGNFGPDGAWMPEALAAHARYEAGKAQALAPYREAVGTVLRSKANNVTAEIDDSILGEVDKLAAGAVHKNGEVLAPPLLSLFGTPEQVGNFAETVVGIRGLHSAGASQVKQLLLGRGPQDIPSLQAQIAAVGAVVNTMDNPGAGPFNAEKLSALDQGRLRTFAAKFGNERFIRELSTTGEDGEARRNAALAELRSFYVETTKLSSMSDAEKEANLKMIWGEDHKAAVPAKVQDILKDENARFKFMGIRFGSIADNYSTRSTTSDGERSVSTLLGRIVTNPVDSAFAAIMQEPTLNRALSFFTDASPQRRVELWKRLTDVGGMDVHVDPKVSAQLVEQATATSLAAGESAAATSAVAAHIKNQNIGANVFTLSTDKIVIEREPIAKVFGDNFTAQAALHGWAKNMEAKGKLPVGFGSMQDRVDAFDFGVTFQQFGPNGERYYAVAAIVKGPGGVQVPMFFPEPLVVPKGAENALVNVRRQAEEAEARRIADARRAGQVSGPSYETQMPMPDEWGRGSATRFSTEAFDQLRKYLAGSNAVYESWSKGTLQEIMRAVGPSDEPAPTTVPRPTLGGTR